MFHREYEIEFLLSIESILAYTITAMHANFVLCLLTSSSSSSSCHIHSTRTCLQSCGLCLRRFFRRCCFCLVLSVWSLSFTATIPLLYTIDSNEKTPTPVYCPGTTQISYLEEWFDRNRIIQSVIFNLIPFLITLFISLIAIFKLIYDYLLCFYLRLKMSRCSPCRMTSSRHHQHRQQRLLIPNSLSMLSSLGIMANNTIQSDLNLVPVTESITPTSDLVITSSNAMLKSYTYWYSSSFLRFLLVLSCCLLACIYPIAMRFYLVYFSVLVPLIFAVLNYSLEQLTPGQETNTNALTMTPSTEQQTNIENRKISLKPLNSTDRRSGKLIQQNSLPRSERIRSNDQYELQSPLIAHADNENDGIDKHKQLLATVSNSSEPLSKLTAHTHIHMQPHQPSLTAKQKYFSNNLYENCSRHTFRR